MANQYLPFATGGSANTMTYSAWASLSTILANGFQSGVASSEQFNTLMRQVSVPTAGLAQWASDTAGANANDDGSPTNFKALIDSAFSAKLSPYLLKSGGTMTGPITTPNGAIGINIGDDARISDRNTANTVYIEGQQNSDRGYINFSNSPYNNLGAINGGSLTWRGSAVLDSSNFSAYALPITGGSISGPVSVGGGLSVSGALVMYGPILFGENGNDTGLRWDSDNTFSAIGANERIMQWGLTEVSSTRPITAPSEAATANNSRLATTAHVTSKINNLFTGSSGNSGWTKNSLGQIEQWGRISLGDVPAGGTAGTFTFPIAFPSECSVCMVTAADSASGISVFTSMGANPSTTSMTWKVGETASLTQSVTIHIWARGH